MRRMLLAGLVAFTVLPLAATPSSDPKPLDLETIMANPDWVGQAVENPYWSVDGRSVYYAVKRDGSPLRDLYRVDPASGKSIKLDAAARAQAGGEPVFDRARRHAAYILHGDVFVVDVASGQRRQVTRTPQDESSPQFSADGRALQYRDGNDWYSYDLGQAVAAPVALLKFADDPRDTPPDALGERQLATFSTLRQVKADKQAMRDEDETLQAADPGRAPMPFWLGDKTKLVDAELSPDGRWMVLVTVPKGADPGKAPQLTHYVTDSGYPESQDARTYVGRGDPAGQSLLLLDLAHHRHYALSTDNLPGIKDDPLQALRHEAVAALEKAGKHERAKALKAPEVRPVRVAGNGGGNIAWSDDGTELAVQLRAIDNKDRWIASVDFSGHALVVQQRLTDAAWVNWNFNDFGWLKNSHALWYLSEQSGYSQLYTKPLDGKPTALTAGRFEVSHPQLSADGRWFYLRSNQVAPYSYDVYRVPSTGGALARVTRYQGMDDFKLSPDGSQLAVLHSSPYRLAQLAVQPAAGGTPRELTDTMKPAFTARHWIEPKIVQVPSSHGAGVIYAKYYGPADGGGKDNGASRPAVLFVHGAGYLQNVTLSATYYFREQMFNNMLVQHGYTVLDMDYRASEGYGRAWRTAIYRNMGHPELEDLLDGKAWLVKNHGVDAGRVGIYGGSYGGFMTEIALLRAPGQFAAGAALRPVSDWTLYNHEYTANILNDPQLDPAAYKTSSPIEYADQLQDPLLIQHGLVDDNVLAEDSIRMYQRLIELHKKDFWISLYPMERHGFVHPDSWYDEYRRVYELFDTYLKPVH